MEQTSHQGIARNGPICRLVDEHEEPRRLDHLVDLPRGWTRETVNPDMWNLPLPSTAAEEIQDLVAAMQEAPLPLLLRKPDGFRLDACRRLMATVKERLTNAMGLAVVDRLPVDNMSKEDATAVYWVLGQFLGMPVATKWNGTLLYDVTDTGQKYGYGVRGSATNVELSFHTDNAFGVALPDYVGLLCHRPAVSGGVSQVCSIYSIHNLMMRQHPRLLKRLYQPCFFDRQAEHAAGAAKVMQAPMFRYDGDRLYARLVPGLVRRGYEMVDQPMDAELVDALQALQLILKDDTLAISFMLERGQIQYAHNQTCPHFRSAFTDHTDPALKRHLVRVWYREQGNQTYDG
ncbi:TauD/TfdA family dioxygenase [Mesorhizobium sp. LSHC414A00]|uniref:TauD/TfdA family dioxygenase n=1 Tax=Mesorhizobium sp. LSHC414A00 TaxID=1287287 RepID=UPI0003CF656F|nr:TauD/TfdA family dioxygenase [Mesorhizobium sp. LSHC414A00]ESX79996.1 hypothetical protein X757_03250 [Mesorhizobium sp. LSHC414A00]